MKLRTIVLSSVCLAAGAFAAVTAAAVQESMMAPKPGPEHEILKKMTGTWEAEVSTQFSPAKEKGTMTTELGPGGLWVLSNFEGTMMGGPFHGHEVMGWDGMKKKYVSCWVDSTGSAMSIGEGTWDEATKTMTMTSKGPDMSGQMSEMTNVIKVIDADHHTFTMHMGGADTPAMMTINYARKK
jgi:hypothetical protein